MVCGSKEWTEGIGGSQLQAAGIDAGMTAEVWKASPPEPGKSYSAKWYTADGSGRHLLRQMPAFFLPAKENDVLEIFGASKINAFSHQNSQFSALDDKYIVRC